MVYKKDLKFFFKEYGGYSRLKKEKIKDWFVEYKDFGEGTSHCNIYNFVNAVKVFGRFGEDDYFYFDWNKIYLKLKVKRGLKNETKK